MKAIRWAGGAALMLLVTAFGWADEAADLFKKGHKALEKQDYDGFLDLSIQRTLADERDYPRARRKEGTARKAPLTRSQSSNAASLRLNAPVLGFERPVDRLDLLPQYSRTGVWRHDP